MLHLTVGEIHDHAREQLDHLKVVEVGQVPAGLGEEKIASKNRNPVVETAVDRIDAPSGGGFIHHIVVNE